MIRTITSFGTYDINRLFGWFISKRQREGFGGFKTTILSFRTLLKSIIYIEGVFTFKNFNEDSKILFCVDDQDREDIKQMTYNVAECAGFNKCDILIWEPRNQFNLIEALKKISLMPIWLYQLRHIIVKAPIKIWLLKLLLQLKDRQEFINRIVNIQKYNLCVVHYDACTFGNHIAQFFKNHKIKTATLQHGVMLAPRPGLENIVDFCGIEFYNFVSDYFLAWNEFTKKEAIKCGIDSNRIIVAGMSKYFVDVRSTRMQETKLIGVILDGKDEMDNNETLINMAKKFAEEMGYHYILRLHPYFRGDEYNHLINPSNGGVCSKNVGLFDFLKNLEFCLLANSTLLFELETLKIPYLRYSSGDIKDKFRDYQSPMFHNYDELKNKYLCQEHVSYMDKIETNNAKRKYETFFSNFSE